MLVAGLVSASQDPPPQNPPVFRGGANLVYVDVYPRRQDRFLEGLSAQDFQVFEDGKPQQVELFEVIRFPPGEPGALVRDPGSRAEGDQLAADPRNRVFVIYLDIYHIAMRGSSVTGPPLTEFFRRYIGPADLFAVLTPIQSVSAFAFSRRIDTIEAELQNNPYWGQARNGLLLHTPHEELLQTCLPRPRETPSIEEAKYRQDFGNILVRIFREDLLMTSLENLVRRLGALKDERKNVLFVSQGWVPQGPQPQLLDDVNVVFPKIGVGPDGKLGIGNRTAGRDVTACDREIARLAVIDFDQRFRRLLTDASLANVSFYTIDVGGESRYTSRGPIETLQTMAAATDGRAILRLDPADLSQGFRQIAEDLEAYYLLGYYSTNPALDGRFRRIDVKVTQPSVTLTARRGYLAPTEEMRRAADAATAKLTARPSAPAPVSEALAELVRVRPDATVYGHGTRTATGLRVTLELSSREVMSGRWRKGGEARVTVTQPNAEPVTATALLAPGARSVVLSVPLETGSSGPWRGRGQLVAGNYSLDLPLDVGAPTAGPIGDAMWFRAAAAVSAPMRPAAERLFRRIERLRIEWPAVAPLDALAARVLDRRGEPIALQPAVSESDGDGQRIVAVDVGLAPLADGDYLIEVVAEQGTNSVRRLVAFRVVR